jgi:DNA-binding NarL/FixJ family response regulator
MVARPAPIIPPKGRLAGGRVDEGARVLVADDEPVLTGGIRAALESNGFSICAEVADTQTAIEAASRERPEICLLNTEAPGDGIRAIAQIRSESPETAVVILASAWEESLILEAVRGGAAGCLLKNIDPARLPHVLRTVLEGETVLPRGLATRLVYEYRNRERFNDLVSSRGRARLTERECEVLELLAQGSDTAAVAEQLVMAPVTVRSHVRSIVKKLHVRDREAALRLVGRPQR